MYSQLSHGNKEERVIPSAPYLTWFWFGEFFKWEILGGGVCVCMCVCVFSFTSLSMWYLNRENDTASEILLCVCSNVPP